MSNIEQIYGVPEVERKLVSYCESRRFIIDCFNTTSIPQSHAEQMADAIVYADYRKSFRLGIERLELSINNLFLKRIDGVTKPKIIKDTLATAWVDGENGLGAVIGNFCMDLAIEKAKNCGLGLVCVKHSNSYGLRSCYAERALKQGLIGITMCNTAPLMVPTRSKQSVIGANPLCIAVPAKNDKFILDMATTAVPLGRIENKKRQGAPMPKGWAQNESGHMTTNANEAFLTACLMPLGGTEETGGYKGYGLGALVDILSGVLSGSDYSTKIQIQNYTDFNSGQIFIVLDPNCFLTDFEDRMTDFINILRSCTPIDPTKPVLIAGDKAQNNIKETEIAGGIEYNEIHLKIFEKLATKLKVKPIKFL